jgi:glycosyltransferase involved in cell wall biosynthesis
MFQRADWIGLRCAKVVVVLTEVMKSYIQELLPRNSRATIVNLPNDINVLHPLVLSRAPKEKAYIALTLGAFSETKNLSFLLEAFSELRAFGSDAWQLKVVGRGDALAAFEAEVKSRGLTSIEVIPWVTQVDSLFEKAALLLHPSRHEGMPNVVLEAMAFGLPVLCADIPELRELMGDERCLMPINEPRALAERLLRMAEDPRLLQELGALIHRRAGELVFDWNGRFEQIVVNLR